MERTFYTVDFGADYEVEEDRKQVPRDKANAVSSREASNKNLHLPAIDIDLPCSVVPSRTEGHFHLYIEHPISWENYKDLLDVLEKCGIVEEGYKQASIFRGATYLRLTEGTP